MRTNKFYWSHVLILDDKNKKLIPRILRRRNVVLIRPLLPLLLISGFLLRETLQNLPYVIYIYYLYTKTQNYFVYFSFHPKYFFILLNHFIWHKPWNWEERSLKYYLRLFCKLWSPQNYKQKKFGPHEGRKIYLIVLCLMLLKRFINIVSSKKKIPLALSLGSPIDQFCKK